MRFHVGNSHNNRGKTTPTCNKNHAHAKQHAFSTSMRAQQQKHTCNHTDTCERHVKHRWELASLKGIMKAQRGGGES